MFGSRKLTMDECSGSGHSPSRPITPVAVQQLNIKPSNGDKINAETIRQRTLVLDTHSHGSYASTRNTHIY